MKILALDTETEPFPTVGRVRTARPCPPLVCVSWACPGAQGVWEWDERPSAFWDKRLSEADEIVFHNAAFDIPVLEAAGIAPEGGWRQAVLDGRVRDTRVMYKLRYPLKDRPATLAAAHKHLTGKELAKDSVRTSFRRDRPLTEEQRSYAIQDAVATLRLFQELRRKAYGELAQIPEEEFVATGAAYKGRDPDLVYSQAAALLSWHLESGLALNREALAEELAAYRQQLGELSAQMVDLGLMRCVSVPGQGEYVVRPDGDPGPPRRWTFRGTSSGGQPIMWRQPRNTDPSVHEERPGRWAVNDTAVRALYAAAAEDLGIKPPLSEKTGKVSTSRDVWKQYHAELSPPLQAHLAYGKVKKILSSFLEPLEGVSHGFDNPRADTSTRGSHRVAGQSARSGQQPKGVESPFGLDSRSPRSSSQEGGVICPQYWIPGAETGRWACSKPNLQQLPKKLRRLYVPRPCRGGSKSVDDRGGDDGGDRIGGSVFVAADYKSLELYTLAHTMAAMGIRGPLLSSLQAGGDVHQLTADAIGCSRQEAKVANFGLPGGLGAKKFKQYAAGFGLDLDFDGARALRDGWFAAYPDVREFMSYFDLDPWTRRPPHLEPEEWLQSLGFDTENETWPRRFQIVRAINNGAIFTVMLPSGRVTPQRHYAAACNFCFQGPGADVITHAFVYAVEAGLEPVAVVHDSINVVCPAHPPEAKKHGDLLARCMQRALEDCCPLVPAPLPEYEISEHLL